ncbi:MAG: hypothetical protein AB1352_01360 [Patescibacteria group bacterium]
MQLSDASSQPEHLGWQYEPPQEWLASCSSVSAPHREHFHPSADAPHMVQVSSPIG